MRRLKHRKRTLEKFSARLAESAADNEPSSLRPEGPRKDLELEELM